MIRVKRPTILLNPGPVVLTERVRQALMREDLCHREPEFAALCLEVKSRLLRAYPAAEGRFEALLLTGSGTAAVEAMLASLVPRDGKALVVSNGVYGERMADMVRAHGKALSQVRSEWLAPMDLEEVERRLSADPAVTHVACIQSETTTGRLNDVAHLGALCRRHGRPLLLDAVSSFGVEELDFERWNLEAVAATANKCLHGAPGISFVLASRAALARGGGHAPSVYLDLARYHAVQESGFSPFTQAVHVIRALREALAELEDEGGVAARRARYRALAGRIRRAARDLGLASLVPEAELGATLSSFRLPPDTGYAELHDGLKEAGFVIYAGQGALAATMFRIANMGDVHEDDVDRLFTALGRLVRR